MRDRDVIWIFYVVLLLAFVLLCNFFELALIIICFVLFYWGFYKLFKWTEKSLFNYFILFVLICGLVLIINMFLT